MGRPGGWGASQSILCAGWVYVHFFKLFQERRGPQEKVGQEGIRPQDAGMGQARRSPSKEIAKGEVMILFAADSPSHPLLD